MYEKDKTFKDSFMYVYIYQYICVCVSAHAPVCV